jgi:hypothetical protein
MRSVRGMQTRGSHVAGLPFKEVLGRPPVHNEGMDGMWSRNSFLLDSSSLAINQLWWLTLRRCSVSSLVIYFFATQSIKLKLGQQIGGDYWFQTTWTNHHDRPIRNTQQQLDHIYYIPMLSKNDFLSQTGDICWLVFIKFYCPDYRWRCSNNWVVSQWKQPLIMCKELSIYLV